MARNIRFPTPRSERTGEPERWNLRYRENLTIHNQEKQQLNGQFSENEFLRNYPLLICVLKFFYFVEFFSWTLEASAGILYFTTFLSCSRMYLFYTLAFFGFIPGFFFFSRFNVFFVFLQFFFFRQWLLLWALIGEDGVIVMVNFDL